MADIRKYGTTQVEESNADLLRCQQIVRTIVQFGVNESQKLKIIKLLAQELESNDSMRDIVALIKRLEQGETGSTLITDV